MSFPSMHRFDQYTHDDMVFRSGYNKGFREGAITIAIPWILSLLLLAVVFFTFR